MAKKDSEERPVVLLCNPQAGGRWKELAAILDSEEARGVRRIVTDSIADIGPALASLGGRTELVCIYGGDGTIQRIIDLMVRNDRSKLPQLAFIGGGTMNVTGSWCGMSRSPARNFREVVEAYRSGQLLIKEVPLLAVQQGERVHHGFTFGIGPMVRILAEYERGSKGKTGALFTAAKAIVATWTNVPASFQPLLREMSGEIIVNGEKLPYEQFSAMFCNVTGRVNVGVEPFTKMRTRESFYFMAYSIDRRELVLLLPFLVRGYPPIDPQSLLRPASGWKQIAMSYFGRGSFPTDPRYINDVASQVEVRSSEKLYTVDGELVVSSGEPILIGLGPRLELAVSHRVGLGPTMRVAADVARLGTKPLRSASGRV